jgi:hypothetical protein
LAGGFGFGLVSCVAGFVCVSCASVVDDKEVVVKVKHNAMIKCFSFIFFSLDKMLIEKRREYTPQQR